MTQVRRKAPSNFGMSPTVQQKLAYIAGKLNLPGIEGMQGSTRIIFDTAILTTSAAARQTLNFFNASNGKSRNFSNFQNQKLSAGEAMVIDQIQFFLVSLSATNLAVDTTTIGDLIPLSQVDAAIVSLEKALQMGIMNINIANSTVVKDAFINEANPSFNPKTTGIALGKALAGDTLPIAQFPSEVIGQNTIYLESAPVLPPDQGFGVTLELPPVGTVTGSIGIVCVAGRFGSIFSAKTTL